VRIDAHAHLVPPVLLADLVAGRLRLPSVAVEPEGASARIVFPGQAARRAVDASLYDLAARRAWLDGRGLDHQVVGPWIDLVGTTLPAAEAADWARAYNEGLLAAAHAEPRLVPLATLPMQSGRDAAAVLERAMAAGMPGCMIATQPNGPGSVLDHPDLDPFWEAADRLRAPVFVHAVARSGDPRLRDFGLGNALGRITDVATAVARLLLTGHLTRFPGAQLVLPIGGAALPLVIGRLARHHAGAGGTVADPREGLARIWADTVVNDPELLAVLGRRLGFERMLMGSDSPFAMGDDDPVATVRGLDLPPETEAAVMGGNAVRLLGTVLTRP
jgi:aminocarboxymuconate-semialdehyde decarboxylase